MRSHSSLVALLVIAAAAAFAQNPPPAVSPADRVAPETVARQKDVELFLDLFRTYEPTQVGLTWDHGDERALDFTISPMFPLFHGYYPDRRSGWNPWPLQKVGLYPYFAATVRDSFYVNTRPSSPVISKRFNPVLMIRRWPGARSGTFLEALYGHESNGQDIASLARFNDQTRVFLGRDFSAATEEERNTARHYARDNISRGWDYWGVHASHGYTLGPVRCTALGKFDYYLRHGLLQGPAEEFNPWEDGARGKRRRFYDGMSVRNTFWLPGRFFDARLAITWTTGTQSPTQNNTWKFELGGRAANVPVCLWYRRGYNSDLVDYYLRDTSVGVAVSFWNF